MNSNTGSSSDNTSFKDQSCQVCSDAARYGCHGAPACPSCFKFFKRYSEEAQQRVCIYDGSCEITIATRADCISCRLSKCRAVGMEIKAGKIEKINTLKCEVCGDQVNMKGLLGKSVCSACVKFYNHNVGKKNQILCKRNGICEITVETRKDCISCRLKKCEEVGMNRNKPLTEQLLWARPKTDVRQNTEEENKEAEDSTKIIQMFYDTCAFTVDKMKRLSPKEFNMLTGLDDRHIDRLNAWQMYSYEMASDMYSTGEFLRGIPRLDEIEMEERLMLLKNNYFPIYLLNIARGLSLRGMYLHDGRMITLDVLELLFGDPLLKQLIDFVESFTVISCSDAETALAIPLLFCRHDKASQKLSEIHRYYTKLLSKNSSERVSKLFEKLVPKLNQISTTYYNELQFVRDNVQFLNLCPIFMEMFEIQFPSDSTTAFNTTKPVDDE